MVIFIKIIIETKNLWQACVFLCINYIIMPFTAYLTKSKISDGPVDSINYMRNI
jgi:hypothetical protein